MNKNLITGLIACGVLVGTVSGATFRYRLSGDWSAVTDGTSEGWGLNPNNSGAPGSLPTNADIARLNWGGNTVTVTSAATAGQVQITVDEPGSLVVANGGSLSVIDGAGPDQNGRIVVGNNDADGLLGTLLVQSGGVVNTDGILFTGLGTDGQTTIEGTATVGSHLWTGWNTGITGTIDINNGGILNVSGQLGLNWQNNGAVGLLNINSGGVVNLQQIHSSGNSIVGSSLLTISEGGLLTKSSNFVSVIQTVYIDTGKIVGEGGAPLSVTYDSDSDLTSIVVVPEPSVFGLLGLAGAGFILRRRRSC